MDQSSVHLQLFLTRSSRTDTASESGERIAKSDQPCRTVTQLCKLNLDISLACVGSRRKNIQNDQRTVHDFAVQLFLQIIKLCRRKLVIADNAGRSQFLHQKGDLLDLSFSDISARVDLFTILDHPSDHQCPGCLTKLCKFIQRFFHIFRKTLLNADQDHPLFQFFHVIWLHK